MLTRNKFSLIDLKSASVKDIRSVFSLAQKFKNQNDSLLFKGRTAALLFFEASTRTRMSFETAAVRLGLHPLILSGSQASSLEKGESLEDTVFNVAAMEPAVIVIRTGSQLNLKDLQLKIDIPILNAGWGPFGHPTQALLDIFTLESKLVSVQGLKLLIVGDIKHSRVAASHFELARILGYQVAICGPSSFLFSEATAQECGVQIFSDLQMALGWCDVVMCLRVQNERHSKGATDATEDFFLYQLTSDHVDKNSHIRAVMHPGPINHGVEMATEVVHHSKSVILDQVQSGVYVRQALLWMSQNYESLKEENR